MFQKNPRTVSQITQNLSNMIAELEESDRLFLERAEKNQEAIRQKQEENAGIEEERARNQAVGGKLKDLLGY